ncbi:FAD-dependent oxidoreductase [Actinomadura citrea]|jgi:kynurenine 3-monooxygenase|uniref:Kynurenine 3-monooxygenase n=1 Tax=Actinomadura citrea TaxID=46158 RepID=A0A7Y9GD26_9ACTN|nr:NAD(P)/FAD-dependent oxidoreductase [Actinomadura citrea]NYE14307.1 kynurenine 3-monooxygenase [Actinomadura citrea]GGT79612.1 kynurenine 3-monooxygenase [Actinomadura citrea]
MAAEGGERVAIVGAGLAGCLLAVLLGRRGIPVTVYERRPDPRVAGTERGRSINLAVSARGLAALEQVGLRDQSLKQALPMHGRMVHPLPGAQNFQPYSADGGRAINSISRAELNRSLLDTAESTPGVTLRFSERVTGVDVEAGALLLEGADPEPADVVLAGDGAYSAVRRSLRLDEDADFLEHGYKELTVPPKDGGFALDPDALHIWPRGTSMMIALPNLDRSFTCTLFWPKEDFAALDTPGKVTAYFERHYPDVAGLMPDLTGDFERNPVGSLVTVRCWPWTRYGKGALVALLGDAAHAIVPFFGQGANCAFEDCIEIDRCLTETGGDWARALSLYQERRKANTDAIAEMALDNFVEMRDRVSSPVYRAKQTATHALERLLAGRYVSRYELVSFSTIPYARIPARIRRQNRVLAAAALGSAAALGLGLRALSRRR